MDSLAASVSEAILRDASEQDARTLLPFTCERIRAAFGAHEARIYAGEMLAVRQPPGSTDKRSTPAIVGRAAAGRPGAWVFAHGNAWSTALRLYGRGAPVVFCARGSRRRDVTRHEPARVASILTAAYALDRFERRAASSELPEPLAIEGLGGVIARDPKMLDVIREAGRLATSDVPILIEGESGTGKEVIAKTIHALSARRDGPFISENCGAIPEHLIEAELFGVERGAYTGAHRSNPGLVERADGGTLFLDEIGEMAFGHQKKLLRVLQERRVRRVGSTTTSDVDFRVVSATNRSLEAMVAARLFREDLFYRLQVAVLRIPPLRSRPDDIPALVTHFNESLAARLAKPPLEFEAGAIEALVGYDWPGNVRELRNEIWRLHAAHDLVVTAQNLAPSLSRRRRRAVSATATLAEVERRVIGDAIREALTQSGGNIAEAARHLDVPRSTLYRRMDRYGLRDTGVQLAMRNASS